MTVEFYDATGTPRPASDLIEAQRVIEEAMIKLLPGSLSSIVTPKLYMQFPVILDALKELLQYRQGAKP